MWRADWAGPAWRRPHWIPEGVIDAAQVCFVIMETDGRVIYANRTLEKLAGCRIRDIFDTPLQDLWGRAQRVRMTNALAQARIRGAAFLPGLTHREPGGIRAVTWNFSLVADPGWGRPAMVGVGLDVTPVQDVGKAARPGPFQS